MSPIFPFKQTVSIYHILFWKAHLERVRYVCASIGHVDDKFCIVCDGDLCFYFGHVLANQRCTSQAVTLSTMLRFAIYSRQICIVTVT